MSPNQVASLTWPGGPTLHVCGCVLCFRETHQCRFPVFPKHLVLDQNHQSHRGFSNGCKYGDAACCPHIPSVQCFFVHNYTYTYLYMYIHDIIQLCIYMILYNYIYIYFCRHRHIITVCVYIECIYIYICSIHICWDTPLRKNSWFLKGNVSLCYCLAEDQASKTKHASSIRKFGYKLGFKPVNPSYIPITHQITKNPWPQGQPKESERGAGGDFDSQTPLV